MFDKYFLMVKSLHVDWFLRRHQFSSITDSAASASVVSPTHIMLVLHFLHENNHWDLSIMGSIFNTYCDDVWKKMSPVDGGLSHFLVEIPIMRLHDASSTLTNVFFLVLH